MARMIRIDPFSYVPLYLTCLYMVAEVGVGTGFAVTREGVNYLITNWHVVTGCHPDTGQPFSKAGAVPDTIMIWYHVAGKPGLWRGKTERLVDAANGAPKWREHPRGREIDVVALPLAQHQDMQVYPLDLSLASVDLIVDPSEPVSIVGFPLGLVAAGKFPIWKTGHVASDMDLDYNDKPVFLIDATTKEGMSGSPVMARRRGLMHLSMGWGVGGERDRFLGVYSGRIQAGSDVGMVWKPEVLDEILP